MDELYVVSQPETTPMCVCMCVCVVWGVGGGSGGANEYQKITLPHTMYG